jgi:SAM-dependent methyltransferase
MAVPLVPARTLPRQLDTLVRPRRAIELATRELKESLLWDLYFSRLPAPKVKGYVPHWEPEVHRQVIAALQTGGIAVEERDVSVEGYHDYLRRADYARFPRYYAGGKAPNFAEKSLEHYVAAQLLALSPGDVYVDVANAHSPVPEIYHDLYGCRTYRQDLLFSAGLHGNVIGGDAGAMPVPDRFATKMALHCSFEHFEGDADSRFIREAARVLAPGGRLCILPLYLYTRYALQTDPATLTLRGLAPDSGAAVYGARGWRERHGRFYDVPHLLSRVRAHMGDLRLTVYAIRNANQVDRSCYLKFAAVFDKEPSP